MIADELRRQADQFVDIVELQPKISRDPAARAAREAREPRHRNSFSAVQPRRAPVPTKKSSRAKFRVARMPRDSHRVASCPAASLHKDAPIPRTIQTVGRTLAMPVLGGLHHQYFRA